MPVVFSTTKRHCHPVNPDALQAAQKLPFGFIARAGFAPLFIWIFPINPEDYSIQNTTKGNVVQTISGAYEDWFGMGSPQGSLRGTFGFRSRRSSVGLIPNPTGLLPGQAQFKMVEMMFKSFYSFSQKDAREREITMDFFSLSDAHFFQVRLTNFQFDRSIRHQYLYRYDIRFVVLKDYFSPVAVGSTLLNVSDAIGNVVTSGVSGIKSAATSIGGLIGGSSAGTAPATWAESAANATYSFKKIG